MDKDLRDLERETRATGDLESAVRWELSLQKTLDPRQIFHEPEPQLVTPTSEGRFYLSLSQGRTPQRDLFYLQVTNYLPRVFGDDSFWAADRSQRCPEWFDGSRQIEFFSLRYRVHFSGENKLAALRENHHHSRMTYLDFSLEVGEDGIDRFARRFEQPIRDWFAANPEFIAQARIIAIRRETHENLIRYKSALNQVAKLREKIGENILRELDLGLSPAEVQRKLTTRKDDQDGDQ